MKYCWGVPLLLAAACASTTRFDPEPQLSARPSDAGAFTVADMGGELEIRHFPIQIDEYLSFTAKVVFDGSPSDGAAEVPSANSLSELAGAIRSLVAPGSWDGGASRWISVEKNELVARHVPAVLDRVEQFLETLKAHRTKRVTLGIRFLNLSPEETPLIQHLPPLREGLGGVIDQRSIYTLKPKDAYKANLSLRGIPNLTLHHGQEAIVKLGARVPYLRGAERKGMGYEAIIDEVTTGLEVKARAVTNGLKSERMLLEVSATFNALNAIQTVKLGDYYVQMPATSPAKTAGQFVLGPDESAVLLIPTPNVRVGNFARPRPDEITLVVIEWVEVP